MKEMNAEASLYGHVSRVHSDRGEMSSKRIKEFVLSRGIRQTFTSASSPQSNRRCERLIGVVKASARSLLVGSSFSPTFWRYAWAHSAFIRRMQMLGLHYKISKLPIFGAPVIALLSDNGGAHAPNTVDGRVLGVDEGTTHSFFVLTKDPSCVEKVLTFTSRKPMGIEFDISKTDPVRVEAREKTSEAGIELPGRGGLLEEGNRPKDELGALGSSSSSSGSASGDGEKSHGSAGTLTSSSAPSSSLSPVSDPSMSLPSAPLSSSSASSSGKPSSSASSYGKSSSSNGPTGCKACDTKAHVPHSREGLCKWAGVPLRRATCPACAGAHVAHWPTRPRAKSKVAIKMVEPEPEESYVPTDVLQPGTQANLRLISEKELLKLR
jgi:hypothetical protein